MTRLMMLAIFLVLALALVAATPAEAGACQNFGHAWAEFGATGDAGQVVSGQAVSGESGSFPVEDGPGVVARIIEWEFDFYCE